MANDDYNYNGEFSIESANPPQKPVTNIKGDINMSDDNKVTFDSIFNQEDAPLKRPYPPQSAAEARTPIYTPQPEAIIPPVYASAPVPPSYPPNPPQAYSAYPYSSYPDAGTAPPLNYTSSTAAVKSKEKVSFKAKAFVICLASVLGFATLGVGLSLGGVLAKRLLPSEIPIRGESAVNQPAVNAYNQPKVEFSQSQYIPGANNVSGIVKKVSDAVVSINLTVTVPNFFNQKTEQPGAGSGIIFDEDDEKVYIATNNHVIQDADTVTISVDDKTQIKASFVGCDPQSDLAVISVSKAEMDKAGIPYELANFGDSSILQVGDDVVAIGNAMGEGKTATSGIVSAINKQITIDGKTLDVIQTDAAINPGNSGGALANINGEVIGINTAKLSSSNVEGMGYSIPSNIAKTILEDLKSNGSVKKPYLGILGMSITEEMMNMYNLPSLGVYVDDVTAGSSAEQAGIEATDIIVGFNDQKITTIDELTSAIAASAVGDKVTIYIYRQGTHPMQFDVVLGNLNPDVKF